MPQWRQSSTGNSFVAADIDRICKFPPASSSARLALAARAAEHLVDDSNSNNSSDGGVLAPRVYDVGEVMNKVLYTVYMSTVNNSAATNSRSARLSASIGTRGTLTLTTLAHTTFHISIHIFIST